MEPAALAGITTDSFVKVRSELDELLLRHSQECGAKVYEQTRVVDLAFEDDDEGRPIRPIGANYVRGGQSGYISFDYLIDASGNKGIMSTKVRPVKLTFCLSTSG